MESSRLFEQFNAIIGKLPQQKLSKLLAFVLVVYLAYLSSTIVWQLVPVQSSQGHIVLPTYVQSSNSTSKSNSDISSILSLNLFGKEGEKSPVKKPVTEQPTSAPKTRLNITLMGLSADPNDPSSVASAAVIESPAGQITYGVEEKIEGTKASVYQIFTDRVILSVSGRYETLMLDGIDYSQPASSASRQVAKKPKKVDLEVSNSTKRRKFDRRDNVELSQELREQREQLFDDPKKLLDVIRIRPYKPNGELAGYRLSPGKDSKLFREVGLKRNDLATNINGYDLTDMQQALSVMAELKTMTEATITVVRNNESIDIILAL